MSTQLLDDDPYDYHEKRFLKHAKNCSECEKAMNIPFTSFPIVPFPKELLCGIGKTLHEDAVKAHEKRSGKK